MLAMDDDRPTYGCSQKTKAGKPCKRLVFEDGAMCSSHRRASNRKASKAKAGELIVLDVAQFAGEAYEYDAPELAAWLRDVRRGLIKVTVYRAMGGSGELKPLELTPDFGTRLQAAALEMKLGPSLKEKAEVSDAEIQADILEALGVE